MSCPAEVPFLLTENTNPIESGTVTPSDGSKMALSESTSSQDSDATNRKALAKFFGVCEKELAIPYSSSLHGKTPKRRDLENVSSGKHSLRSSGSNNSIDEAWNKEKTSDDIGLWLKEKTSTFKRKDGTLGAKSEKDISLGDGSFGKRKNKARRFAAMLETGLNRKKKLNGTVNDRRRQTDEGLFKLHANFPDSGLTCRRVFVGGTSKAEDIVRDFLDLCPVSYESYNDFVLCDVIGWYHSKPNEAEVSADPKAMRRSLIGWKEECFRILEGKENPLVVQSLWVPREGCSRRFEIRRKIDAAESKANLAYFSLFEDNMGVSYSSDGSPLIRRWDQSSDDGNHDYEFPWSQGGKKSKRSNAENEETESSDESASTANNVRPPKHRPYIVCIQGYSVEKDLLYYALNKETVILGNPDNVFVDDAIAGDLDIILSAPDILSRHGILTCHRVAELDEGNPSLDNFVVSLESCQGGKITLNGCQLHQEVELRPGDLISIGSYYHFIFRDATSKYQTLFGIRWMGPGHREEDGIYSEHPQLAEEARRYESDVDRWKMACKVEHESEVMEFLSSLLRGDEGDTGLASGHLFLMMIEFAAYTQGPEQTKMMLLNIANTLLQITETKAKEMVNIHAQSRAKQDMDSLIPDLKVLLVALSNSLELLNYLQPKLADYLPPSSTTSESSSAGGDKEVLSILEEVVMYSFQQCVYYITKTLYESLPHILSSNPFTDDDDASEPTGVSEIITIFRKTLDLLQGVSVHPEMISQMFAYLLFFMNAALFNVLLERAGSGKYLKWSKGVQLRGNLDIVESWILENGKEDQLKFLRRISSAADMLATPKIQLTQATWTSLRKDYPHLNPAQLHQLLSKYEIGNNTERPEEWSPHDEELKDAKEKDTILESFEDHPPLMLPAELSQLDLCTFHELPGFKEFLETLQERLPFMQVYQGACLVGSRRHTRAPPEKPSRINVPPVETDDKNASQTSHKDKTIYATVNPDKKNNRHSKPSISKKKPGARNSAPDLIPGLPLINKKQGEKEFPKKYSLTSPPRASLRVTGVKMHSTDIDQRKAEEQIHQMAPEEEEATGLLDAYISEASRDSYGISEKYQHAYVRRSFSENAVAEKEAATFSSISTLENTSENASSMSTNALSTNIFDNSEELELSKQGQRPSEKVKIREERIPDKRMEISSAIDEIYVVDITPEDGELGIKFSNGLKSVDMPGVYIAEFEPNSTAFLCGGLQVGDRILAVDGHSLVGFEYEEALAFIVKPRSSYRILVARTDCESDEEEVTSHVTAV